MSQKIDGLAGQLHHLNQLVQKQNELIAKQQHMPSGSSSMVHCPPADSSILEWLLRPNTVDDGTNLKPTLEPQLFSNSVLPFFDVTDETYHSVDADLTPAFVSPASTMLTTLSDTRSSEATTTPSLPFGDI